MYCLTGNNSILVHTVLLFDVVVYITYALTFKYKLSRWVVSVTLSANVFLIFLLLLMEVTGVDIEWRWQIGSLALGALLGAADFIGQFMLLSDLTLASMLIISAQVSNSFVPELLESQYGLTQAAANTLALLIPLLVFYSIIFLVKCEAVRALFRCLALALLVTFAYILYSASISPDGTVCCDVNASCPVMPTTGDVIIFIALSLVLVLAVLYEAARDVVRGCRRCCGWCCSCSCDLGCCKLGFCRSKEDVHEDIKDDEDDEEDEDPQPREDEPLLIDSIKLE